MLPPNSNSVRSPILSPFPRHPWPFEGGATRWSTDGPPPRRRPPPVAATAPCARPRLPWRPWPWRRWRQQGCSSEVHPRCLGLDGALDMLPPKIIQDGHRRWFKDHFYFSVTNCQWWVWLCLYPKHKGCLRIVASCDRQNYQRSYKETPVFEDNPKSCTVQHADLCPLFLECGVGIRHLYRSYTMTNGPKGAIFPYLLDISFLQCIFKTWNCPVPTASWSPIFERKDEKRNPLVAESKEV